MQDVPGGIEWIIKYTTVNPAQWERMPHVSYLVYVANQLIKIVLSVAIQEKTICVMQQLDRVRLFVPMKGAGVKKFFLRVLTIAKEEKLMSDSIVYQSIDPNCRLHNYLMHQYPRILPLTSRRKLDIRDKARKLREIEAKN